MFYETPYRELGFRDDEWEAITSGDKRLIRSYVLNGYNETRTVLFDEYNDDSRLRKLIHRYDLLQRPRVQVTLESFTLYPAN